MKAIMVCPAFLPMKAGQPWADMSCTERDGCGGRRLTIAVQQCGVAAVQLEALPVCDEHGDLCAVLAGHKHLHTAQQRHRLLACCSVICEGAALQYSLGCTQQAVHPINSVMQPSWVSLHVVQLGITIMTRQPVGGCVWMHVTQHGRQQSKQAGWDG